MATRPSDVRPPLPLPVVADERKGFIGVGTIIVFIVFMSFAASCVFAVAVSSPPRERGGDPAPTEPAAVVDHREAIESGSFCDYQVPLPGAPAYVAGEPARAQVHVRSRVGMAPAELSSQIVISPEVVDPAETSTSRAPIAAVACVAPLTNEPTGETCSYLDAFVDPSVAQRIDLPLVTTRYQIVVFLVRTAEELVAGEILPAVVDCPSQITVLDTEAVGEGVTEADIALWLSRQLEGGRPR